MSPPPAADAFPAGVGSHDPTADSVVLWTEAGFAGNLRWEIGPADRADPAPIATGELETAAGPCSVRVGGLPAATSLTYRFRLSDAASPVGRARTLPEPAATPDRVRLGVACCARLPTRDLAAYSGLAGSAPDLVVHLGDYIYEDGRPPHVPPHACRSEADYDERYRQYRRDRHLRTLHAAAPWMTIWDDHEVADDAWRGGSADDPAGEDWPERRRVALAAHERWLPSDPDAAGPTPMDRRARFGGLIDVVLLDARHAGRTAPVRRSSGPALVAPDDDRRLLTDEQWEWLAAAAADCPGWFVLATQVQVSPLRLAWLPDRRRRFRPSPLVNPGQWDGYPVERRRLAEVLAPVRGRALILSGDLHGRFVTRLVANGAAVPEMTTPSVASVPFARAVRRRVPIPEPVLTRWLDLINPPIDHLDLTGHGTTVVDVEPDRIVLGALDPGGARTAAWQLRRGDDRLAHATPGVWHQA